MTDVPSSNSTAAPRDADQAPQGGGFTIVDQRNLLATTKEVPHLPVPLHSWRRIREKTSQIGGEPWILPGLATTSLGGALAASFSLLTEVTGGSTRDTWWFLAVCLMGTVGFGTAALVNRSRNRATADQVLSVMEDVEALINMPT